MFVGARGGTDCHRSGANNLELAARFFENLFTERSVQTM